MRARERERKRERQKTEREREGGRCHLGRSAAALASLPSHPVEVLGLPAACCKTGSANSVAIPKATP